MSSSFEQKSVSITLASLVLVIGLYFVVAGPMLLAGITLLAPYAALFIVATVLLVVVLVVGHITAAVVTRPEQPDERDRLIEWRSESGSSWVLGAGVFMAMSMLVTPLPKVWAAHLLLVSLFGSEILKAMLRLRDYRRGI